jgi:hypothetical protein
MSGTLVSQLILKINATGTIALDLDTPDDPLVKDYTQLLSSGTGLNQASNMFHDQRTLTASSTENLDLSGVLTNAFGVVLTFTKIKVLFVKAAVANTNDVLLGNGTNPFIGPFGAAGASVVTVKPGGIALFIAPDANGYAVTAATGDILKVANSAAGTSVTYDIVILGTD